MDDPEMKVPLEMFPWSNTDYFRFYAGDFEIHMIFITVSNRDSIISTVNSDGSEREKRKSKEQDT